jgi:hypothetical protein
MCVSILTPAIFRSSWPAFYSIDPRRRFWTPRGTRFPRGIDYLPSTRFRRPPENQEIA